MTIGSCLWIPAGVIHRLSRVLPSMKERTTLDRVRVHLSMSDPPRPLQDVRITAPEGTQLAELVDVLANERRMAVRPSTVWSGSLRLESTAPLGGAGLRNGDVLRFGGPGRQDSTTAPCQAAAIYSCPIPRYRVGIWLSP